MSKVEIYTKDYCQFCARAKALLDAKGVPFTEYDITYDAEGQQEAIERSGGFTVPQILIDGRPLGGSGELAELEETGDLDRLLNVPVAA